MMFKTSVLDKELRGLKMKSLKTVFLFMFIGMLTACGGGGGSEPTVNDYTIGGTVSGLVGTGLVLQNNGGDDLTISSDGSFVFASAIADGASYTGGVFSVLFFFQDTDNYYEYRIDTFNRETSVHKVVGGVSTQIGAPISEDIVPKASYIYNLSGFNIK